MSNSPSTESASKLGSGAFNRSRKPNLTLTIPKYESSLPVTTPPPPTTILISPSINHPGGIVECGRPSLSRGRRAREENIEGGESWGMTFLRHPAAPPTEIIPGLYLCNMKTAGAYLVGCAPPPEQQTHRSTADLTTTEGSSDGTSGNDEKGKQPLFPPVSRVLTILAQDMGRAGYPNMPKPGGPQSHIQCWFVGKTDRPNTNLLENFDQVTEWMHEGVGAYMQGLTQKQDSIDFITDQFSAMKIDDNDVPESDTSSLANNMSKIERTLFGKDNSRPVGGVLVHCHMGISRSATFIIAYLLKYHLYLVSQPSSTRVERGEGTEEQEEDDPVMKMIEFVRTKRSFISPNLGFRSQLKRYVSMDCSLYDEHGQIKSQYIEYLEVMEEEEREFESKSNRKLVAK